MGNVHVKGEFLIQEIEHFVMSGIGQEIEAGANVLLRRLGNKVDLKRVTARSYTIRASVISAVYSSGVSHVRRSLAPEVNSPTAQFSAQVTSSGQSVASHVLPV